MSPSVEDAPVAITTVVEPVANETWSARHERLALPSTVDSRRVYWIYLIPITAVHLLALLAFVPWLFSWTGVVVMLLGVHLFGAVGINLCYHRLLTHRSFKVPKWLERFFVFLSLCCMEDTPAKWVSTHRIHHNFSDHEPDPHSPWVTFLWGHMDWLFRHNSATNNVATYEKYARDVVQDPFYMYLEKNLVWFFIYVAHALTFFVAGAGIGWLMGGTAMAALQFGLSLFVWGAMVRTVLVWHITWSVNSLTHMYGYRNYNTDEHSTNNWLVGLWAAGEGWHNNHHFDQASASNQHRWWELDTTYYTIKLLEWCGLATDIIPPKHQRHSGRTVRRNGSESSALPS